MKQSENRKLFELTFPKKSFLILIGISLFSCNQKKQSRQDKKAQITNTHLDKINSRC
jgi:hypothetical protein